MSVTDRFLRFNRGEGEQILVSPLYSEVLPRAWSSLPPHLPQNDPAMLEAKLAVGERCGFPPIIKIEIGCLGLIEPEVELLEEDGERQRLRHRYATADGDLTCVFSKLGDHTHGESQLIASIEDTLRMAWFWENRADWETFRLRLGEIVRRVGERGMVCLNVGHPFGSFQDHVTTIFYTLEHSREMRDVAERMCQVRRRMIDEASALGVRCFFAGSLGSNMYSPKMVEEWMEPYCIQLREHCHTHGAIYYLHECGNMRHKLERGIYGRILPDWLEGFEAPPLGDIEELHAVRRQLPPEIAFKGNLNLQDLATLSPARIEVQVRKLLTTVAGYRHIVGGACSLLGDTPPENLEALVRASASDYLHVTSAPSN